MEPAYNIMCEQLKFCKVCARWVLRQLTEEQKMFRIGLSLTEPQLVHSRRRGLHGTNCYKRRVLGAPLSTRIENIFHGMETFHLVNKRKVQGDSISPQDYAHHVLGHARGHTAEIPASW